MILYPKIQEIELMNKMRDVDAKVRQISKDKNLTENEKEIEIENALTTIHNILKNSTEFSKRDVLECIVPRGYQLNIRRTLYSAQIRRIVACAAKLRLRKNEQLPGRLVPKSSTKHNLLKIAALLVKLVEYNHGNPILSVSGEYLANFPGINCTTMTISECLTALRALCLPGKYLSLIDVVDKNGQMFIQGSYKKGDFVPFINKYWVNVEALKELIELNKDNINFYDPSSIIYTSSKKIKKYNKLSKKIADQRKYEFDVKMFGEEKAARRRDIQMEREKKKLEKVKEYQKEFQHEVKLAKTLPVLMNLDLVFNYLSYDEATLESNARLTSALCNTKNDHGTLNSTRDEYLKLIFGLKRRDRVKFDDFDITSCIYKFQYLFSNIGKEIPKDLYREFYFNMFPDSSEELYHHFRKTIKAMCMRVYMGNGSTLAFNASKMKIWLKYAMNEATEEDFERWLNEYLRKKENKELITLDDRVKAYPNRFIDEDLKKAQEMAEFHQVTFKEIFIRLNRAMKSVFCMRENEKFFKEEIFVHESNIILRTLEKLQKMNLRAVPLYDCFYFIEGTINKKMLEELVMDTAIDYFIELRVKREAQAKAEFYEGISFISTEFSQIEKIQHAPKHKQISKFTYWKRRFNKTARDLHHLISIWGKELFNNIVPTLTIFNKELSFN